jgi:CheY-like chemotaxis protein
MRDRPLNRILVVDDDADILAAATLALDRAGHYTVQPCASAREALEHASLFRPDLILLDVMMPDIDGFGALRALRQIEATAETAVVFMTTMVKRHEMAQYQEVGCLGVVPKPFDPAVLPELLERMWGSERSRPIESHQREFEELRRAYLRGLPEKIGAMRAAAAVLATEGWDRATVESLYHLAHRMAGSSGLYHLSALSRSAGALEGVVKRLLSAPTWPPSASTRELAMMVTGVDRAARNEMRLARPSAPGSAPDG